MDIIINDKEIEVISGETLLETAKRAGYPIPFLCYVKGAVHRASCMVCVVKNRTNGQIIPSCTTLPTADMVIETDSDEVRQIRFLSIELLLSDHRADCEAPCSLVCPKGLDIEQFLSFYDAHQPEKSRLLLSEVFNLPEIACETCKAPCEKACRRGTIDSAVSIREIIREIAGIMPPQPCPSEKEISNNKTDKKSFQSRLGRFSTSEKERLRAAVTSASRCLHCACAGRTNCKLRQYATAEGIKRPRFDVTSALPVMLIQPVTNNLYYEQAKCIRCGLCVYNSQNGFTFKDRGFGMSVVLPDENRMNIKDEVIALCPTGALYKKTK